MLSLQSHPAFVIASPSDLNRNDFPSDHQDSHRRDSARSIAEPPTWPDSPAIGTDSNSTSSDGERPPHGSPPGWGVRIYQNPFADSSLASPSSSTTLEYSTVPPSHENFPNDDVVPKIEELDDGEELHRIKPSHVGNDDDATGVPDNVPRKRGRPRKHPLPVPVKATKGRSKTGCITCRRRKKKCDETKPAYLSLLCLPSHGR